MQPPDEASRLCERCKKRPATARYTHATTKEVISEMACATCFDWLVVYNALHDRFSHIVDLEFREQYDEALACLDEILEANRHRDHERWLALHIAMHRAYILFDAGRYMEAEQACNAWAELGITDVGERWMHGALTADVLDALGRPREGLAVLEEALRHRDPKDVPGAWGRLRDLARLSKKLGQPVDPTWRSLAEETAAANGVEMPERESLGEAILALAVAIGGEKQLDDDDDEP